MFTLITVKAFTARIWRNVASKCGCRPLPWYAGLFSQGVIAFGSSLESCPCVGHCKMSWKPHEILGSNLTGACQFTLFTSWHHVFQRHSAVKLLQPIYSNTVCFADCRPSRRLQLWNKPTAFCTSSITDPFMMVNISQNCPCKVAVLSSTLTIVSNAHIKGEKKKKDCICSAKKSCNQCTCNSGRNNLSDTANRSMLHVRGCLTVWTDAPAPLGSLSTLTTLTFS